MATKRQLSIYQVETGRTSLLTRGGHAHVNGLELLKLLTIGKIQNWTAIPISLATYCIDRTTFCLHFLLLPYFRILV